MELTFPYTQDRFERLRATLAAKGFNLVGNSGEVKDMGADVAYGYDGTTLTLTVKHAPFLHSMWVFCQQLQQAIDAQQ